MDALRDSVCAHPYSFGKNASAAYEFLLRKHQRACINELETSFIRDTIQLDSDSALHSIRSPDTGMARLRLTFQ